MNTFDYRSLKARSAIETHLVAEGRSAKLANFLSAALDDSEAVPAAQPYLNGTEEVLDMATILDQIAESGYGRFVADYEEAQAKIDAVDKGIARYLQLPPGQRKEQLLALSQLCLPKDAQE